MEIWLKPDAPDGFLVHCHAGDDPIVCKRLVSETFGLKPSGRLRLAVTPKRSERNGDNDRIEVASKLWQRSHNGRGTLAEIYLASRAIVLADWPATLRFLAANPPNHLWPTLIATYGMPTEPEPGKLKITPASIVGVQLTYLREDGNGKAPIDPDKRSIGRGHTMPIVLAPMNDLLGLVITEGIEDALSAHLATGLGAWAAGGAGRMPSLANVVPEHTSWVTILADDNDAGRKGAKGPFRQAAGSRHRR
jgi:hypothetical protein